MKEVAGQARLTRVVSLYLGQYRAPQELRGGEGCGEEVVQSEPEEVMEGVNFQCAVQQVDD